jgi:hypothetical protein
MRWVVDFVLPGLWDRAEPKDAPKPELGLELAREAKQVMEVEVLDAQKPWKLIGPGRLTA